MKKITALVISMMMLLFAVGCGGDAARGADTRKPPHAQKTCGFLYQNQKGAFFPWNTTPSAV